MIMRIMIKKYFLHYLSFMLSGDHLFENGFEEDTLYRSEKSIMQELLADDTYFKVKKLIEFY